MCNCVNSQAKPTLRHKKLQPNMQDFSANTNLPLKPI
uniref:60S ribosomal protein L35 n=1 Tax=Arundo donax TaxID=35708 RepID=A0A0A9ETD5_ARUDO